MIYNVYTISIGNATIIYSDDLVRGYVGIGIESKRDEDCIELGFLDTTSKNNSKRVSTNNFSKLLLESTNDIYELFMGKEGFFRGPEQINCYPINHEHLDVIEEAIDTWESQHPDCKEKIPYKGLEPADYDELTLTDQMEICSKYDWVYANLVWLKFWFEKSLSEDDYPTILVKPMML